MTSFLDLHGREGRPLLLPNPWDLGSARLLASLGFEALATTSSGFAATLGRLDHRVSREEALAYAAAIAAGVDLPVSADLENGFADEPELVADTVRLAAAAGLAGCSIEDATGWDDDPIYGMEHAAARIEAAAGAARAAGVPFVLTARAENHLHGRDDLADTIARLQAFEAAGRRRALRAGARADAGHLPGGPVRRQARQRPRPRGRPARGRPRPGRGPPRVGGRRACLRRLRGAGRGRARAPRGGDVRLQRARRRRAAGRARRVRAGGVNGGAASRSAVARATGNRPSGPA